MISRSRAPKKYARLNRPVSGSMVASRTASSRARRCSLARTMPTYARRISAVRFTPTVAIVSFGSGSGRPTEIAARYARLATAVSTTVALDDTTSAAPPTMSGNVKKNGLDACPVIRTSSAANVIATDPSMTNFAGPSASAGSTSCTTRTKRPASATRTRIPGCCSRHSPVTATTTEVARRNTQATTRTTRSNAAADSAAPSGSRTGMVGAGGAVGVAGERLPKVGAMRRGPDESASPRPSTSPEGPIRRRRRRLGERTAAISARLASTAIVIRSRIASIGTCALPAIARRAHPMVSPDRRIASRNARGIASRWTRTAHDVRPSVASTHRSVVHRDVSRSAGAPLLRLLHHAELDERVGLADSQDLPQSFGEEAQQGVVVLAHGLDEEVVRTGGDDDVVDLREGCDLAGDLHELLGLAPDADHRHLVKAELERVGHADDLEDPALDEPVRPGAYRGLRHAEIGRDLGERAATVLLEVLDDPLVERRDVLGSSARSTAGLGHFPGVALGARAEVAGDGRRPGAVDGAVPLGAAGTVTGVTALTSSGPRTGSSAA